MLRRLQAFFVLGVWAAATTAAAQEPADEPTDKPKSEDQPSAQAGPGPVALEESAPEESTPEESDARKPAPEEPTAKKSKGEQSAEAKAELGLTAGGDLEAKPKSEAELSAEMEEPAAAEEAVSEEEAADHPEGWHAEVHGYFRAPVAMGFSSRQDTSGSTLVGPERMQISYGPTRTVDANYYSFAYTRLQEQDWAELSVHAKKKHVEAVIGWMGYWFQGAGPRNPDAAWLPGNAYLKLDTDVEAVSLAPNTAPNVALTAGAWWPHFGAFPKYDTYTLGQFRQIGEQLKFTVPLPADLKVTLVQGFGASRDGNFLYTAPAPWQSQNIALDLIQYYNINVAWDKYVDVGLHYNTEWCRDPYKWWHGQTGSGKGYEDVRAAHLTVVGAEVNLSAPYAGHLWISPSYLTVRNGWALDWAGTEVMHSIGGRGIADNYMAFTNDPGTSTGTGSMINLGFLYENTLSSVLGKEPATEAPEVTLNVFGLFTEARRDLPAGSQIAQYNGVKQFKYGADVTVQALNWLGVMLRYDEVNYDLDNPGYIFSAISPRIIFSSHFLSSESFYVQYSRYHYGDNMKLQQKTPWNTPLMVGSDQYQGVGPYVGQTPDEDVVRLQATVNF